MPFIKNISSYTTYYKLIKNMSVDLSLNFEASSTGTITDFKYSPTGSYLAVADSEGFVQIFFRNANTFKKVSEFRADQASIWGVAWAETEYGNLLGIGSFKNKVAIFQESQQGWKEIAYHQLHQASVNWVEWSPCGLKLFAGSSDGSVSVLQLVHKQWKTNIFKATESSISFLAVQPLPLGEIIAQGNRESFYPRIATVGKDQKIKLWAHQSERNYCQNSSHLEEKQFNSCGYTQIKQHFCDKQTVKNILWRPSWGTINDSLKEIQLVYCTQEGSLKVLHWETKDDKINVKAILGGDIPFTRVSQSMTGNCLTASTIVKQKMETTVLVEDGGEWKVVKAGNL